MLIVVLYFVKTVFSGVKACYFGGMLFIKSPMGHYLPLLKMQNGISPFLFGDELNAVVCACPATGQEKGYRHYTCTPPP